MKKRIGRNLTVQRPPLIEELFEPWRNTLGVDFDGYRNHCFRLYNFCFALTGGSDSERELKIAIATAFHDLGIWTDKTFDYIPHSIRLAGEYLVKTGRNDWIDEISTMIAEHHKLTQFKANTSWLVESFRKADLIDLSGGLIRFRLDDEFVREVLEEFPNAGFHKTLVQLSLKRLKTHPFSPLPMVKW